MCFINKKNNFQNYFLLYPRLVSRANILNSDDMSPASDEKDRSSSDTSNPNVTNESTIYFLHSKL